MPCSGLSPGAGWGQPEVPAATDFALATSNLGHPYGLWLPFYYRKSPLKQAGK